MRLHTRLRDGVTILTPRAIGVLIDAYRDHKAREAQLKLCSLGAKIDQIFVITKLCLVFGDDQYDTEEEAMASFTAAGPERDAMTTPPDGKADGVTADETL